MYVQKSELTLKVKQTYVSLYNFIFTEFMKYFSHPHPTEVLGEFFSL